MMTTVSNNRAIFEGQNCPTRPLLHLLRSNADPLAHPRLACLSKHSPLSTSRLALGFLPSTRISPT
jgi:hypothetical protein